MGRWTISTCLCLPEHDGQWHLYHVKNVAGGSALDKVDFSIGVCVICSCAGANEEGRRKVVAQDGSSTVIISDEGSLWFGCLLRDNVRKSRLNVGNIYQHPWAKTVTAENLEVVAIRVLSGGAIAVVGEVSDGQVISGDVFKVGQADDGLDVGQGAVGRELQYIFNASVWLVEEWPGGKGTRGQEGYNSGLDMHLGRRSETKGTAGEEEQTLKLKRLVLAVTLGVVLQSPTLRTMRIYVYIERAGLRLESWVRSLIINAQRHGPRAPSSTRTSWLCDLVSLHLGLD